MSNPTETPEQPQSTEQELIAVRTEKMQQLRALGIDPYGQKFPVTTTPGELKANFENDKPVTIAGRLLAIRDMGKSVFFTIGDVHGRIQGYLNQKGLFSQKHSALCLISGTEFLTARQNTASVT